MEPLKTRKPVTRRRVFSIVAGTMTAIATARANARSSFTWRGVAMGADASLIFRDRDRGLAEAAAHLCADEIERLENEFSLFRVSSSLSLLNKEVVIHNPNHDFLTLLTRAKHYAEQTNGAFDPTIQPLWNLYAKHFGGTQHPQDSTGPTQKMVDESLHRVGYGNIDIGDDAVRLNNGAAVSLNGIAQGYVTDRITDLLRSLGWDHVLINMGETRAITPPNSERAWRIAIPGTESGPGVSLRNRAVATSSASGTPLTADHRFHHLFNARTGACPQHYESISVVANSAILADAASTALFSVSPDRLERLVDVLCLDTVYARLQNGRVLILANKRLT